MRCLAVCQDELVIRMLDEILLPGFEVEFIVESKPVARRLHDAGVQSSPAIPRRTDTFVKADLGPGTCVIIEDNGRREPHEDSRGRARRRRHARLRPRRRHRGRTGAREEQSTPSFPTSPTSRCRSCSAARSLTEFSRSLTRARVQQYQRYFADADRVLIMLHNDPDPDAMASGLALQKRPAPDEDDRDHRRDPGRDAAGKPADGEPARHPRRGRHARVAEGIRPRRHGGRAAALLRRAHRPRRSGHRSSSRAAGLHGGLQGRPRPTTDRPRRSSPSTCGPST